MASPGARHLTPKVHNAGVAWMSVAILFFALALGVLA
jgi:hypothetical protein